MKKLGRFFKRVGKIAATPVVVPAKLVKKGAEKTMQAAILGVVRHVLTALGGGLVANGTLADAELQQGIGAAMVIVGIVASVIQKRRSTKPVEPPRAIYVLPIVLAGALAFAACDGRNPVQPSTNPPVIALFDAQPSRVPLGQTATLRWEVIDEQAEVRIDPAPGNVPHVGSYTFTPTSFGVYNFTLTARNKNGTTQRFITISVP